MFEKEYIETALYLISKSNTGLFFGNIGFCLEPLIVAFLHERGPAFSIRFSDKYCASDAAFRLVDLLEQSASMGKSVDFSKYTYRNFVDSGAQTEVQSFIQSALDVSKNAVLSYQNQGQDRALDWG